jgi:hypothetical protein
VVDATGPMPAVADTAIHAYEVGIVATYVGNQGVAPVAILGRLVDKPVRVMQGPAVGPPVD